MSALPSKASSSNSIMIAGEAAIAENATARRGQYKFGAALPVGGAGNVDRSRKKRLSWRKRRRTDYSNEIIQQPFETRTIDGVPFVFQLALDSEAPSEMLIYLPESHVLDVAEDAAHPLHHGLPFRGTVVRDANRWSRYLNRETPRLLSPLRGALHACPPCPRSP